jgi:hypothetical protein
LGACSPLCCAAASPPGDSGPVTCWACVASECSGLSGVCWPAMCSPDECGALLCCNAWSGAFAGDSNPPVCCPPAGPCGCAECCSGDEPDAGASAPPVCCTGDAPDAGASTPATCCTGATGDCNGADSDSAVGGPNSGGISPRRFSSSSTSSGSSFTMCSPSARLQQPTTPTKDARRSTQIRVSARSSAQPATHHSGCHAVLGVTATDTPWPGHPEHSSRSASGVLGVTATDSSVARAPHDLCHTDSVPWRA